MNLATQFSDSGLRLDLNEQAQGFLNGGALGAPATAAHGCAHQAVVNLDICAHGCNSDVYRITFIVYRLLAAAKDAGGSVRALRDATTNL
jgi:hypothetical protein